MDVRRQPLSEMLAALGEALPERVAGAAAKRRTDYAAGRLCARQTLVRLTGVAAVPGMETDGRPVWPAGLCGSISHGAGRAVAVAALAARYSGLGVDVEEVFSPARARELEDLILTADERRRLADREPTLVATAAFSLKESLFKALNPLTGAQFFHEDAELTCLADGCAQLRLLRALSPSWPAGAVVPGRYRISENRLFSLITIPRADARTDDRP